MKRLPAAGWITCLAVSVASLAAAGEPLRTVEWTSQQDWPAGVEVFAGVGLGPSIVSLY